MLKFLNLKFLKGIFPCLLLIGVQPGLKAQQHMVEGDVLKSRLATITLNNNQAKLFVHYDKTIYVPNESVWFTAYLLNSDTLNITPDILSVVLVNNSDRSLVLQKKFVFSGATSSGSFLVPDSIAEGDYSIIAYVNHLIKGKPDISYSQRIAVKRAELQDSKDIPKKVSKPVFTTSDSAGFNIRFYPEGGDLVEGLPAYVGWEAKDSAGASLKLKAVLIENNQLVDTVETSTAGMGRFFVRPKAGRKYALRLIGADSQAQFELPAARQSGITIGVNSALVKNTLMLRVASTTPGKIHVVVHNARQVFYLLTNIDPEKNGIFRIALDSVPCGLAAVTIYNEQEEPCAERIFFAHYDHPQVASVKSDKQQYGKRQKVTLKLNLNSVIDSQALVSVACVQSSRIDRRHFNDIDNYSFLDEELNALPAMFSKDIATRKDYLEDVLLIKGWRRYKDTVAPADRPSDAAMHFTGTIKVNGKEAKKPKTLTLMGNGNVFFINTDKQGRFTIPRDNLIAADEKVFALFATSDDAFTIHISLQDPFLQINRSFTLKLPVYVSEVSSGERFIDPAVLLSQDKIQLKAVKINARPIDERFNPSARPGMHKNACGDYICMAGALNCPYPGHLYATSVPIKGHRYIRHVGERHDDSPFIIMANVPFIYEGCDTKNHSLIRFGGINLDKEYYPYTKTDVDNSEPLYNSTLYWGSQVKLTKGKQKEISFYTGDVSGEFSVIMQGITPAGVVYSEDKFEVTK